MNDTQSTPHYRVVTTLSPPYVMLNRQTNVFYGYCIDLLTEMQKALNFTYEIYEVEDGQAGTINANGTWNGMVKDVMDGKADFGASLIYHIAHRETVIDFTLPIDDAVGFAILIGKPKKPRNYFEFITILDYKIWLCIIASYLGTSFLLWFFDRWSPLSFRNNRQKNRPVAEAETRIFTFKECLWFCLMSMTPQGCGKVPRNFSGKFVAATWWIFSFIILSTYNANLAVLLTESGMGVTFKSLEDLLHQQKVQYGVIEHSASHDHFENLARIESKFHEIWVNMVFNNTMTPEDRNRLSVWDYPYKKKYSNMVDTMKSYGLPANLSEALLRVRNWRAPYALIEGGVRARYLTSSNCDFVLVGKQFNERPVTWIIQKNSKLTTQLNHVIHRLSLLGELKDLHKKWWDNITVECEAEPDSSLNPIDFYTIGGAFCLILIGSALGYIGLFVEYLFSRKKKVAQPKPVDFRSLKLGHRPAPFPH